MKTYNQLTPTEQTKAVAKCANRLLESITEGAIRFNDRLNGDTLQARIDAAWKKAEEMQTPWFAHEYVMDTCAEDINSMAQCDAEDSLYSGPDERVVPGITTSIPTPGISGNKVEVL